MKGIAIYVEGGDTAQQNAELRTGFDQLLSSQKQAAREKRLGWKLVPSASRNSAYDAFINEMRRVDGILCVLLVDSEGSVAAETKGNPKGNAIIRKQHVVQRDGWNLKGVEAEQIHLMVQCMEAWIVADPEALAKYYGKNFHAKSLPSRANLEQEPKSEVSKKLTKATKATGKGPYAKIKHASKLLRLIDPKKVAARCPRFKTFASWLGEQISNV